VNPAVQQFVEAFDALTEADKRCATVEILRRFSPESDVPEAALLEAADDLFRALDAEEATHAQR
jgi:hypothetical protein